MPAAVSQLSLKLLDARAMTTMPSALISNPKTPSAAAIRNMRFIVDPRQEAWYEPYRFNSVTVNRRPLGFTEPG